jgi:hypothetical protein
MELVLEQFLAALFSHFRLSFLDSSRQADRVDWLEQACQIDRLDQELLEKYPEWIQLAVPGIDLRSQFDRLERATETDVDGAIECYIQTRQWPDMSAPTGAMLRCRVLLPKNPQGPKTPASLQNR